MMKYALLAAAATWLIPTLGDTADPARPNILWITCEDISPNIGCYGDEYAVTPNIDALAKQGVRYTNAFAPIGVCAPARSCLITGMYPPSIGSQHMRCRGTLPEYVRGYAEYLRKAGYYATNNSKTDYNWKHPKSTWDQCNRQAHWRNRPSKDQPFFAIFNFTTCHESQIRLPEKAYRNRTKDFKPDELHDPAKARVPPYHPDTPEVRKDWARYADMITYMDKQVGDILRQLDEDRLADDTIVWYYSDHGAGMPRSKRWLYDSSIRVPLIVRFPEEYRRLSPEGARPGSVTDRLVSFIDFGPTALSLAGVKIPDHMQGRAFLGTQAASPRQYIYGFRDRMDERYDMVRCVRDKRYKYIRNFMPHKPWFGPEQYINYMYQMPTMRVWQRLYDEGKLEGPQRSFFEPKPIEELYDTQADQDEVNNLASSPDHQGTLKRLRTACREWQIRIVDLGLLPEGDLRSRFGGQPEYEAARKDPSSYPLKRLLDAADLANQRDPRNASKLLKLLARDRDPAERWWGAVGLVALGTGARPALDALSEAIHEPSPSVRVMAAKALCNLGEVKEALPVLVNGLQDENPWVRLRAANILDQLDEKARPAVGAMRKALKDTNGYVGRTIGKALKDLGA